MNNDLPRKSKIIITGTSDGTKDGRPDAAYFQTTYKSFPLEESILRFNTEVDEIPIIRELEKTYKISLVPFIRLVPISVESAMESESKIEDGAIDGKPQSAIIYYLQILKGEPLLSVGLLSELMSKLSCLDVVDCFSE